MAYMRILQGVGLSRGLFGDYHPDYLGIIQGIIGGLYGNYVGIIWRVYEEYIRNVMIPR